ncbi:hypothetical protein XENOCAPTIV_018211, partial [Xenoophorus captivus]
CFLPFLNGQHILVRTNNTPAVACINRQGGQHSLQFHTSMHTDQMEPHTSPVAQCYPCTGSSELQSGYANQGRYVI